MKWVIDMLKSYRNFPKTFSSHASAGMSVLTRIVADRVPGQTFLRLSPYNKVITLKKRWELGSLSSSVYFMEPKTPQRNVADLAVSTIDQIHTPVDSVVRFLRNELTNTLVSNGISTNFFFNWLATTPITFAIDSTIVRQSEALQSPVNDWRTFLGYPRTQGAISDREKILDYVLYLLRAETPHTLMRTYGIILLYALIFYLVCLLCRKDDEETGGVVVCREPRNVPTIEFPGYTDPRPNDDKEEELETSGDPPEKNQVTSILRRLGLSAKGILALINRRPIVVSGDRVIIKYVEQYASLECHLCRSIRFVQRGLVLYYVIHYRGYAFSYCVECASITPHTVRVCGFDVHWRSPFEVPPTS